MSIIQPAILDTQVNDLGIGVDLPDVVRFGVPVSVTATSLDDDPSLPIHVVCEGEDGQVFGGPKLMHATGDGRYRAAIDRLSAGGWRITVRSATPGRPVKPVSDWTLVLNPDAVQ
jgi:hypothetical protein